MVSSFSPSSSLNYARQSKRLFSETRSSCCGSVEGELSPIDYISIIWTINTSAHRTRLTFSHVSMPLFWWLLFLCVPAVQLILLGFQLFYTSLFGSYAGYIFLQTGSLVSATLCHSFCNLMGFPETSFMNSWSPLYKYRFGTWSVMDITCMLLFIITTWNLWSLTQAAKSIMELIFSGLINVICCVFSLLLLFLLLRLL